MVGTLGSRSTRSTVAPRMRKSSRKALRAPEENASTAASPTRRTASATTSSRRHGRRPAPARDPARRQASRARRSPRRAAGDGPRARSSILLQLSTQSLQRARGSRLHGPAAHRENTAPSPPRRARADSGRRARGGRRRGAARAPPAARRALRRRRHSPRGTEPRPPREARALLAASALTTPLGPSPVTRLVGDDREQPGPHGCARRKRGRARQAFVKASWLASSASAALRVMTYAVRKAISWWVRTSTPNAAASPPRARSTSSSSVGGRLTTRVFIHRICVPGSGLAGPGRHARPDGDECRLPSLRRGKRAEPEVLRRVRQRAPAACPSCGAANPPGTKFCGECGTPLGAAAPAADARRRRRRRSGGSSRCSSPTSSASRRCRKAVTPRRRASFCPATSTRPHD